MKGLESISEIERLKILKSIRVGCTSEEEFEDSIKDLDIGMSSENIKRRLNGLFLEDEFILLCNLMGTCNTINAIEQGRTSQKNATPPDFIASFSPSCQLNGLTKEELAFNTKVFAEIKTTEKENKKIKIEKQQEFANSFNIPLIIVSRITSEPSTRWWIAQTGKQLQEKNQRISIESLNNSISDILFDDFFVCASQDIEIYKEYTSSRTTTEIKNIYGQRLNSLTLEISGKTVSIQEEYLGMNIFLDSFPQQKIDSERNSNGDLKERYRLCAGTMLLASSILLNTNNRIISNDEVNINPARVLKKVETGEIKLFGREFLNLALQFFNHSTRAFVIEGLGDPRRKQERINQLKAEGY